MGKGEINPLIGMPVMSLVRISQCLQMVISAGLNMDIFIPTEIHTVLLGDVPQDVSHGVLLVNLLTFSDSDMQR